MAAEKHAKDKRKCRSPVRRNKCFDAPQPRGNNELKTRKRGCVSDVKANTKVRNPEVTHAGKTRRETSDQYRQLSKEECYSIYSDIFCRINRHRTDNNAESLQFSKKVSQLAWKHAREIYKSKEMYMPTPSSNAMGLYVGDVPVSEMGEKLFNEQLQAPGHEREMLNPHKTFCGLGVYGDVYRISVVEIFS